MLNHAKIFEDDRYKFWPKAVNTAIKLDNILIKPGQKQCPYEKFYNAIPGFVNHLAPFGKLCVVGNSGQKDKTKDKGEYYMMLGYAEDSPSR